MDATAYYTKNAQSHNQEQENDTSSVFRARRLPANPTEVDWAVWWLHQEGKRGTCIDIGCAHLTFLRSVKSMFEQRYGVDIAACDNWARHPEIKTQVHNVDEGPLPFPDQTFDAVVMLMVLEHVFDPFAAVRELRRVCKADGRVVIGVPNLASIRHRFDLLRGRLPVTSARFSFQEDAWDGYHLHNFTQDSLSWLLRIEGLEPLQWASAGSLQMLKRLRPSLFGGDLVVLCRPTQPNRGLPPHF